MKCGGWQDSRRVHFALCISMATVISDVAHRNITHIRPKILIQAKVLRRWASFSYVVVNFLFQLIFIFPLFWGMIMYANEFKTKEKQKLTEIKN